MRLQSLVKYMLEQHPYLKYIRQEAKQVMYTLYIVYGIMLYFKQRRPEHELLVQGLHLNRMYHSPIEADRSTIRHRNERTLFVEEMTGMVQRTPVGTLMKMFKQYHARPLNYRAYITLTQYKTRSERISHIIKVFSNTPEKNVRDRIRDVWEDMGNESRLGDIIADYTVFRLTKPTIKLEKHTTEICTMLELPDGRLASAAYNDKVIRIWNTSSGSCTELTNDRVDDISHLQRMANGDLVHSGTVDSKRNIVVWNLATGTFRNFEYNGHLEDLVVSPSRPYTILYVSREPAWGIRRKLYKIDTTTGTVVELLWNDNCFTVLWLRDGHIACKVFRDVMICNIDTKLTVVKNLRFTWGDLDESKPCALLQLHDGSLACVGIKRDTFEFATEIFDLETGETIQAMEPQRLRGGLTSRKFTILQSPDGTLVTLIHDVVSIWKLVNNIYYELSTTPFRIANGYLYSEPPESFKSGIITTLWNDIVTATCGWEVLDPALEKPDYRLIRVWEPDTGECVSQVDIGEYTTCLFMMSNGKLATGSADGIIRLWG